MTYTPPYSLRGESGKTLDSSWHTLEKLGIHAAALTLRSLAEDEFFFTQRWVEGRIIPDDEQWISLADGRGEIILTGIAKRTFQFPQNIYQFFIYNVYRGMTQTPLTDAVTSRPYTLYTEADLDVTLRSLITRAQTIGLPIQAPASLPTMFAVPKMAFVSASCASALEDALKWMPDCATRMDYATAPPTLRFSRRSSSSPVLLNLDAPGHGVTSMHLTPMPDARALSVVFVYAVRDGSLIVNYQTQSAGDDSAEAHRSISIYLSGHERTDMLSSEALVTAANATSTARVALDAANASIVAGNAAITASNNAITAANAAIVASNANNTYAASSTLSTTLGAIPADPGVFNALAYAVAHDTALATALSGTEAWQTGTVALYNGFVVSGTSYATQSSYSTWLYFTTAAAPTVGVSPAAVVPTGTFTDAQLATAGATKTAGLIKGTAMFGGAQTYGNHGYPILCQGYPADRYASNEMGAAAFQTWAYATLAGTAVDLLDMSVSAIRAALTTAAYAASAAYLAAHPDVSPADLATAGWQVTRTVGTFVDQAAYVEAPENLASNYFEAQNWLPYSGQLTFTPLAPMLPGPGDFVSIVADGLPADFAGMATPVSALQIDLQTGAATVTLGPSARMTFYSLQDRLRIPPVDNYQPA